MADTPLDIVQAKRKADGEIFRLPRHVVEHSDGLELTPSQRKRDSEAKAAEESGYDVAVAEAVTADATPKSTSRPRTPNTTAETPKES